MAKLLIIIVMSLLFIAGCALLKNTSTDPNNPSNTVITGMSHTAIAAGTAATVLPEPYSTILLLLSTTAASAVAIWKNEQLKKARKR